MFMHVVLTIMLFYYFDFKRLLAYWNTLSKYPDGHPILYRGLKLNSKISAGKYKKKFTGVSWFSIRENLSKSYV